MPRIVVDGVEYAPDSPGGGDRPPPLGSLLSARRKDLGMSLSVASKKAGISKAYLWALESGKMTDPGLRVAASIADVLGIPLKLLARSAEVSRNA